MLDIEAWLEMLRPVNIIMAGLGVAIGYFLAVKGFPVTENLGLAMLSAMVIASSGMIINDYFDRFIDARIKPHRPIPSGRVKAIHALIASVVIFGIGVWLAYLINDMTAIIALSAAVLLILYSWFFARTPLVGNCIVALNTGLLFVFGEAAATRRIFSLNISVLFTLAFLSTLAREIYKDVEDVEGDKIVRKTLPMVIGREWSMWVAGLFALLAVIASPVPYILGGLSIDYLVSVAIADLIFVYIVFSGVVKGKVYSKELKIAQLIALISFLIGM